MKEGSHTGGFVSPGVCWCLLYGVKSGVLPVGLHQPC